MYTVIDIYNICVFVHMWSEYQMITPADKLEFARTRDLNACTV